MKKLRFAFVALFALSALVVSFATPGGPGGVPAGTEVGASRPTRRSVISVWQKSRSTLPGIGVTKSQLAQMKRRLAVLDATTNRPVSAAIQVRDAKATFREKFAANLAALAAAETELKPLRDLRKAVKRTEKNLSKIVKTLQQAIKKARDEEEAALYQAIIDLLTEAGAEEGD